MNKPPLEPQQFVLHFVDGESEKYPYIGHLLVSSSNPELMIIGGFDKKKLEPKIAYHHPLLDEKFDPFRSKMILMRHIDRMDRADHQGANGLFGWSNMADTGDSFDGLPASIDKLMAEKLFANAFPPLNLSVRWTDTGASCSYSVTAEGSLVMDPGLYPEQAFEKLFAGFEVDEDTATRRRRYKQTLVDRVLPHYKEVRGNPRLSSADQALLDQHIDHTVTPQSNAKVLVAVFPGVVGYHKGFSVGHHFAGFPQGVPLKASATDRTHPFSVITDQHSRPGTAIGGSPHLNNSGKGDLALGEVGFPEGVNNRFLLFHGT